MDRAHPRWPLTAIGWLVEADHPERVFATRTEALAWAREMLGRGDRG